MALTDITHDAQDFVPPAEVAEEELYHPKTWLGKYVFSQDAKIIALQYSITAMGVGLLALVLSVLMRIQLAWPGAVSFITPDAYIQFVTMHGMIMVIYLLTALFLGGVWKLFNTINGRRTRHGLSLCQYDQLLDLFGGGFGSSGKFFHTRWANRVGLDALSATGNSAWDPRVGLGYYPDVYFTGNFCCRFYDGRIELCRDGSAGPYPGYDTDANAPDRMGDLHSHHTGIAGVSGTLGQRHYDEFG